MRDIRIKPALNGWIVNVGCTTVVFESLTKMCYELENYILNPDKVEKEYQNNAKNQMEQAPQERAPQERPILPSVIE